ncbi:MAG: flavodoxin domain-containing protein [Bacteroidales bacterium]|nr:flavodoxin domain-containing protein [Bacteroidales bacterium]
MKKVVILYWAKGGNAEKAANVVYAKLGSEVADIFDLESFDMDQLLQYKLALLGGSTVGADKWEDATNDNMWNRFFRTIENRDLSEMTFAAFGLGNQLLYPDNFVDALGIFHDEIAKTNARIIGRWPVTGYRFTNSEGAQKDEFYGLALDEDTEPELTEDRVTRWLAQIQKEIEL